MQITSLRYYDGIPSTTSIIKYKTPPLEFVSMWQAKIDKAENREEEQKKMDDIMAMACKRGSYVHRFLEQYFKGDMKFYNEDPKILAYVNGAINFLSAFGKNLTPLEVNGRTMVEMPLMSKELGYAGTPDLPCEMNGRKIMLDYKTASTPKLSTEMLVKYKLQIAALVKLSETLYPEHIYDEGNIQVITDKRKNGLGEQYIVTREELDNLWLEFEVYKNGFNAELALEDPTTLKNYLEEDPIMAMDRKIN